jgi:hypothetical protein
MPVCLPYGGDELAKTACYASPMAPEHSGGMPSDSFNKGQLLRRIQQSHIGTTIRGLRWIGHVTWLSLPGERVA